MGVIKTTIVIDEDVWKKFCIKVMEDNGGRKRNGVIGSLIKNYVLNG